MKNSEKNDEDFSSNFGFFFLEKFLTKRKIFFLEFSKIGLAFLVVKPDLVAAGKTQEILVEVRLVFVVFLSEFFSFQLEKNGFQIHAKIQHIFSDDQIREIFKPVRTDFVAFWGWGRC